MHDNGINRIKIPIENNEIFVEKIDKISKIESLADFLAGTTLKREQLIFLYESIDIIWKTPLKEKLVYDISQYQIKNLLDLNSNCVIRKTIPCLMI